MSLESAIKALNVTPAEQTAAPETPVNMANSGANEQTTTAPQASQDVKENGANSEKTGGVVESAPEAPVAAAKPEETKKEEPLSAKFAALAKKEKAVVKLREEVKAKEAAISAREAAIAEREAKIKEAEQLFDTDPFAALEKRGYTYQKLTDMILSGKTTVEKKPEDPVEVAKRIADDLRKEFAEKEKAREEAAKKAQEEAKKKQEEELAAAYEQYRGEVAAFVEQNSDQYELINMYGQQELVIDTVNGYYETHKRVLSVKEACDMVESYLDEEAKKVFAAKKYKKQQEEAKPATPKKEEPKAPSKTLSNNMTPTMASTLPAKSESERMKRALAALNQTR